MDCNASNARDLSYCGGTLHIGTTQATGTITVFIRNEATGRTAAIVSTGTLPDIEVFLPSLAPGQVYRISISDDKPFTPYASDTVIGTTAVTSIFVRFVKLFDGDNEVITVDDQYLKLVP